MHIGSKCSRGVIGSIREGQRRVICRRSATIQATGTVTPARARVGCAKQDQHDRPLSSSLPVGVHDRQMDAHPVTSFNGTARSQSDVWGNVGGAAAGPRERAVLLFARQPPHEARRNLSDPYQSVRPSSPRVAVVHAPDNDSELFRRGRKPFSRQRIPDVVYR